MPLCSDMKAAVVFLSLEYNVAIYEGLIARFAFNGNVPAKRRQLAWQAGALARCAPGPGQKLTP